jgi:hypothetical protein
MVGVGVLMGRYSVGVTGSVKVATGDSLATGEGNSTVLIGVRVAVGSARIIGWQDENSIKNPQTTTIFLSTFRVYHKIYW